MFCKNCSVKYSVPSINSTGAHSCEEVALVLFCFCGCEHRDLLYDHDGCCWCPVWAGHSHCVSVQGLRPLEDSAFVVFKGESFRDTLLTSSADVKCDGRAFGAFPGCVTRCFTLTSRFLQPRPVKVTIYTT